MKHKRRNIVLIGFMGSGKTTLGLKLSYLLRMPVEDTDKLIERQEGRSITQIFADDGESYFRELETELLPFSVSMAAISSASQVTGTCSSERSL